MRKGRQQAWHLHVDKLIFSIEACLIDKFTIAKYAPEPLTDPIFLPSRSLTLLIVLLFFTISAFLCSPTSARHDA